MNGRTNSTPVETENLEIPLEAPTNLTADPGNGLVTLKWTDPENKYAVVIGDTAEETDQLVSEFDHSVVVRKNNSDPIDPSDGTVVVTATKNQYQSTGYIDSNLPNDIEYHYGVYAINKAGIPSSGIYTHATPMSYRAASTFPVGSIFKMNISGEPWEFIIVQQGNPDNSKYNPNCNGTWLFMTKCYTDRPIDSSNEYANTYYQTELYYYLNSDFYNLFDTSHKDIIKSVNIPQLYVTDRNTAYGSSLISTKIFPISAAELGFEDYQFTGNYTEGCTLEYFKNANPDRDSAEPIRVPADNKSYWTRTPVKGISPNRFVSIPNGRINVNSAVIYSYGVRPVMIIDPNAMFNDNGELLIT